MLSLSSLVAHVRWHARHAPAWHAAAVAGLDDAALREIVRPARTEQGAVRLVAEHLALPLVRRAVEAPGVCVVRRPDGSDEAMPIRLERVSLADLVDEAPAAVPIPLATPPMWWVVDKRTAAQMRGSRMPAPKGGRVFGVFATPEAADDCYDAIPCAHMQAEIVHI